MHQHDHAWGVSDQLPADSRGAAIGCRQIENDIVDGENRAFEHCLAADFADGTVHIDAVRRTVEQMLRVEFALSIMRQERRIAGLPVVS